MSLVTCGLESARPAVVRSDVPMSNAAAHVPRGAFAVLLSVPSLTILTGAVIERGISGILSVFSEVPGTGILRRLLLAWSGVAVLAAFAMGWWTRRW
jgi:hypothetical protein